MRPSVNQVECHIGPEEVGDGSRDRSLDASQEGYLDDFYWFFEASPRNCQTHHRVPVSSACPQLETPSGL